jgi:tetratricopeptide (TPR) repeat protein
MRKRRRITGYRSERERGGFGVLIWIGILVNVVLIGFSIGEGDLRLPDGFARGRTDAAAALMAFEQGDFDAAISGAESALDDTPNDPQALMTLVRALIYRSYTDFPHEPDRQQALRIAQEAAETAPDQPDILAAHAFALQANGQPVRAVEVAEQALALDPNHTLARTALALGYAGVGSFEVALRESEIALENDANTSARLDARRAVAIATADLGNYARAGELLDDLIREQRRFVPLYFERALYARQISEAAAVENAYFTVLTLQPDNLKARMRLCEYASDIGESERAFTYCSEATTLMPERAEGWYRLGRQHFLNGAFADAQAAFNQCSTLQVRQGTPPESLIFECWYLQGQAAEIEGDCRSLITIYNQFQMFAADNAVRETWTYPPEGPPNCQ